MWYKIRLRKFGQTGQQVAVKLTASRSMPKFLGGKHPTCISAIFFHVESKHLVVFNVRAGVSWAGQGRVGMPGSYLSCAPGMPRCLRGTYCPAWLTAPA